MADNDEFWENMAVLFLGFAGVALVASWLKPRCPYCNEKLLERGVTICPNCGNYLRWDSDGE